MPRLSAGLAILIAIFACRLEAKDELKLSVDEQALLDEMNAERKKADLPPLRPSAKLFEAARGHSQNMAKQEKLEHTLDEKTFGDRIEAAGYKAGAMAENVAWNAPDGKAALGFWLDSPPHKENMLGKDFTEVGIGAAVSAKGEKYWTAVFAAPR